MAKIPQVDHKVITFGKYKGDTWEEVIHDDPNYVLWILANVEISEFLYEYIHELLEEAGIE